MVVNVVFCRFIQKGFGYVIIGLKGSIVDLIVVNFKIFGILYRFFKNKLNGIDIFIVYFNNEVFNF